MGKRVVIVDDLTGEELKDGDGGTVTFAVEGTEYSLDLSDKSKEKFDKALAPFIQNATKLGGRQARRSGGSAPARTDKEQLQAAREWLRAHGHEVSSRGRIKAELWELYQSAS